jgi:hypothetical protein
MSYYTVLVNKGSAQESTDTFEATDFDDAAAIVRAKYPEKAFRLYLGKTIPEKKGNQAIPPTFHKK